MYTVNAEHPEMAGTELLHVRLVRFFFFRSKEGTDLVKRH